eukprot:4248395-Prorocentrum_lima.AAC.1
MTSSLVGSEMCIRDRSLPTGCATSRRTRSSTSARRLRRRATTPSRSRCCLLYTSDAADDM